jgi:hypothetical protein
MVVTEKVQNTMGEQMSYLFDQEAAPFLGLTGRGVDGDDDVSQ